MTLLRPRPGPYYRIYLPMDVIRGTTFPDASCDNTIYGDPALMPAKIVNGCNLNGQRKYVDLGDYGESCAGKVSLSTQAKNKDKWR